jgi:uncharacterized protein
MKISGYAAVYNSDSTDMGFIEQIAPGAFDESLKTANVRALFNHDANFPLATTGNGTLRLTSNQIGLYYEITVDPNDRAAMDVAARVERGDVSGASFSFNVQEQQWDYVSSPPRRVLTKLNLIDVGPVTFAAYPAATASATGTGRSASRSSERRVGKTISKQTAASIQSAVDALEALLADGQTSPSPNEPDTSPLIDETLEQDSVSPDMLLNKTLEADAAPDTPGLPLETDTLRPVTYDRLPSRSITVMEGRRLLAGHVQRVECEAEHTRFLRAVDRMATQARVEAMLGPNHATPLRGLPEVVRSIWEVKR